MALQSCELMGLHRLGNGWAWGTGTRLIRQFNGLWLPNGIREPMSGKPRKKNENHGYNNYGICWQFYGEIKFKKYF